MFLFNFCLTFTQILRIEMRISFWVFSQLCPSLFPFIPQAHVDESPWVEASHILQHKQ